MKQSDVSTEFAYRVRSLVEGRGGRPKHCMTPLTIASYRIAKRGRFWELSDAQGEIVCLTAYKKGAIEVVRRLSAVSSVDAV